jgi:fatty-acyl-CoA synthase
MVATGGTTGVSKASRRDWDGYMRMADLGATPQRRQLIVTPLAYIAQILADGVLIGGGTVVLHRAFDAATVLRSLGTYRITHMTVIEPQLVELAYCPELEHVDLSTVSAITHIGADAAASLRARILRRLGRPLLVNPYGASEVGMVSALAGPEYSLDHPELLDTSGKPSPEVAVRVVDDCGNICAAGQSGTIQVHSPAQAQGYSVAPTSSGFRDDGWFSTGDLGELNGSGYLRVRGRRVDLRVVDGRSLLPIDFQEAFCARPGVRYAVAVPHPDGDGFGLALVLDAGVDVEEVVESVRADAGAHLVPVAAVVVDTMPRTEQGKPDRGVLNRLLWPA